MLCQVDAVITVTFLLGRQLRLREVGSLAQGHKAKSRAGVELGQSGSRVCAPDHSPLLALIWGLPASGGGHLTELRLEKGFNFASSKGENKKIFSPAA